MPKFAGVSNVWWFFFFFLLILERKVKNQSNERAWHQKNQFMQRYNRLSNHFLKILLNFSSAILFFFFWNIFYLIWGFSSRICVEKSFLFGKFVVLRVRIENMQGRVEVLKRRGENYVCGIPVMNWWCHVSMSWI